MQRIKRKPDDLKHEVIATLDKSRKQLIDLSLGIHSNPEIAFEEEQAATSITELLESNGFQLERGICNLPTAFKASYGSGSPVIGFFAEYDSLPKLGHACGHNIIASSATGGGIATKPAIDALGGTIVVMGTPAEEAVGGKVILAEAFILGRFGSKNEIF